jgi:hypothetical protein
MRGGAVPAQRVSKVLAVGDEGVEKAENFADVRGHPIRIGLEGIDRCGGYIEHGRIRAQKANESKENPPLKEYFLRGCQRAPPYPMTLDPALSPDPEAPDVAAYNLRFRSTQC